MGQIPITHYKITIIDKITFVWYDISINITRSADEKRRLLSTLSGDDF